MQLSSSMPVLTRFYNIARIEKESFRLLEMILLKPDQRKLDNDLAIISILACL
jgi:hypothetical protein